MKKNNNKYDVKDFELKLFTSLLSSAILVTSFKVYQQDKNNPKGEINVIKCNKEEIIKEPSNIRKNNQSYTYTELEPTSDDYYRSIKVGGRTINFVNTPTPTCDLIDSYSDEMIIAEDGVYPEGYLEYLDMKEHSLNFETTDEAISFYSKVFELNEDVSSKVIKDIVGNKEYNLKEPVVLNDSDYNTYEEGISRILRDLSSSPDNYGYSEDEVRNQDGYQLDYYYPEELIYKFSNVLDVNPYIALSIAYGECGRNLDSYLFVNNHNAGGIVSGSGFAKYRNEAVGMFEFVKLLHDRYYVDAESDYSRLKNISNSGYSENPSHWIGLVGSIYYDLCENGYGSTFYNRRYNGRDLIYCDEQQKSFYNSKYYTLKKDEN